MSALFNDKYLFSAALVMDQLEAAVRTATENVKQKKAERLLRMQMLGFGYD